jgi:hypothetical protein
VKFKLWSMGITAQKSYIENLMQILAFLGTQLAQKKTAFGLGP